MCKGLMMKRWLVIVLIVMMTGGATAQPATVTPSPTSSVPMALIRAVVLARDLPSPGAMSLATLEPGDLVEIINTSRDGLWLGIKLPDFNFTLWIPASSLVEVSGDISLLAAITPSPTPSQTPSPTATVTPTLIPTVDEDAIVSTAVARVFATLTAEATPTPSHTPTPANLRSGMRVEVSADDDPALGSTDAPIVMIQFGDYIDPYSKRFANETLPRILEAYGDQLRFVYRDMPILGEPSVQAALAAECADDQGSYWDYHDKLVASSVSLNREQFIEFAEEIGISVPTFTACLDNERHLEEVNSDYADAAALGITGVPTFFINGRAITGALRFEAFARVLDEALAETTS
jgi:protein-disulfide isomerase